MKIDLGKHIFIQELPDLDRKLTIEISGQANLPEICLAFEDYLRGCGYSFKGYVAIVEEE